jgi:hypothetical protein
MSSSPPGPRWRFPWGYATAITLPFVAILGVTVLDLLKGPDYSMTAGAALICLLGPYFGVVIIWGMWRLQRGDSRTYPALRWLVWAPIVLGVLALLWS